MAYVGMATFMINMRRFPEPIRIGIGNGGETVPHRMKECLRVSERATRICIIYYSSAGTLRRMAEALVEGAETAGAEVRLRRVPEFDEATGPIPLVDAPQLTDLAWADGIALGTPARFGNVAAELKRFIDSTHPLWEQGALVDKAVTGFTAAGSEHGGQEVTLMALYQSVYHWGGLIMPAGYVDPVQREAGGNPYGLSARSSRSGQISPATAGAARVLGSRLTSVAGRLHRAPVAVS
jgi:NAD(P)H dehydrogenase (quinone)